MVEKPTYKVDLEYNETYAILHLPVVEKFTKTVYLDMTRAFEQIKEFLYTIGYEAIFVATEKDTPTEKLAFKMGFLYLGDHENLSVYIYGGNE